MIYIKQNETLVSLVAAGEKYTLQPIGTVYVQFPGKSSPNTLFPGTTWTDITSNWTDYYFRNNDGYFPVISSTVGLCACHYMNCNSITKCSTTVGTTITNAGCHCHSMRDCKNGTGTHSCGCSGSVACSRYRCSCTATSGTGVGNCAVHYHCYCICGNSLETRPNSIAVRIWRRSA